MKIDQERIKAVLCPPDGGAQVAPSRAEIRSRTIGGDDEFITVALASTCAMLAACQSVSDVVPAGSGTYMVGSEVRGGFSSWAEVRALTLNRANEYCVSQGKEMQAVDSKTRGARLDTPRG